MASNIYNEGRVVGYSAYEIYVRHAMSEGMQPISEKEWLLSTLTEGSSLLMRLTSTMLDRNGNALSTAGSHIVDIPLPTAPSRYEVTTREPSDWSAYFTRYYTRSGIAPNYTYTQITTEPIPTWVRNKYYTRIPPDTYQLQESQPANWATNWSYAYTRSGVAPNYIYTPATSWEPNKYYRTVVTHLIAANTIVASLFLGNGVYENGSYWASHVGNYGQLLGNTTPLPTSTYKDAEDVEPIGSYDFPTQATKMLLYANITDGIIITPGTWSPSSTTPPGNDFTPDLSDSAGQQVVRLYINNPITQTIQILLTGFLLKSNLNGMTDTTGGSINTVNPEDGDFLGPAVFPWANKIIFSIPNSFVDFIYNRKLIIDGVTPPTGTEVINKSIIDADTEGLRTYYGNGTAYNSAVHSILSSGKNASDDVPYEVLTIYSRKNVLPPALYVSQVDETVERGVSAYPVDTVAPGTVKIFNSDGRLADAKNETSAVNQITGNVGMYRDADYILHQTVPANESAPTDPISDVEVIQSSTADRADLQGENSFIVEHTSGKKSAESISLLDTLGNILDRTGIHPPAFDTHRVYEFDANQLIHIQTEPSNWNITYDSYYWHTLREWVGDGVTDSFSFPSASIPTELKAVTVNDYLVAYGTDWTYANGVITFSVAPVDNAIISAFVDPPATFETITPFDGSSTRFPKREGTLHWDDLLFALANNKAIDLFDNDYFRSRLFNTLRAGAGIAIQYDDTSASNPIEIINTAIDTSKLPSLDKTDYDVLYQYQDGCCGQFKINVQDATNPKFSIRYSAAKPGVPAAIYIKSSDKNYLTCEDFSRSSVTDSNTGRPLPTAQLSDPDVYGDTRPNFYPNAFYRTQEDLSTNISTAPDWTTNDNWKNYYKVVNQFWFRHTKTDFVGIQMSRMVRIKLKFDNVVDGKTLKERLHLSSITNVTDTSEGSAGIWNVQNSASKEVGASWQAGCKIEACDDPSDNGSSIFIYGISYADGWNTQIGASALTIDPAAITIPSGGGSVQVKLSEAYPNGQNLKSTHINLKVSAILEGTYYDNNI